MSKRLNRSNLQVSEVLVHFIENEALAKTDINAEIFWNKFEKILDKFAPQNKDLLKTRDIMKSSIDQFYKENTGKKINPDDYINFLKKINYIVPVGNDFKVNTQNVDPELSIKAGPQLVVPVTNARYALNAAKAK
jgi:malate synthase